MLEFIPSRQVSQRLSDGWRIFAYNDGDYAAVMHAPDGWKPLLLNDKAPVRVCSMDGCEGPHYALGYCHKHWKRVNRLGTPLLPSYECSEVDCHRKRRGRGLCEMHLARVRRKEKAMLRCREAA